MKKILSVLLFCLISTSAFAKISFESIDLNSQDEVLFTVKQDMTGINTYSSLFYAKLKNNTLKLSEMQEIASKKIQFVRKEVSKKEALDYFTKKGDVIYLIFTKWPKERIVVLSTGKKVRDVRPLGFAAQVDWRQEDDVLSISVPPVDPTGLPTGAWTLRIE